MKSRYDEEAGFSHLIILLALLVAVSGIGYTVAKHSHKNNLSNTAASQTTVEDKAALSTDLSSLMDIEELKQAVQTAKPGSEISQVGLVQTDAGPTFHVQLADGSFLNVNAKNGQKVSAEVENEPEGSSIPKDFVPGISFDEARKIAMSKVPDQQIKRMELEIEEAVPAYKVLFTNGARVDVNAADGSILKANTHSLEKKQNSKNSSKDSSSHKNSLNKETSEQHSTGVASSKTGDDSGTSGTSGSGGSTESGSGSGSGSGSDSGSGGHGGSGHDSSTDN